MFNHINRSSRPALILACILSGQIAQLCYAASPAPNKTNTTGVTKLVATLDVGKLAKTSKNRIVAKTANVRDDIPFMNGEPEHIEITFDTDKDNNANWQRKIEIYPIASYGQLFKGREKVEFDKTIASLKTILNKKSTDGVKALPILPPLDMYEIFHNHAHILNCKNGTGVASIVCYGQDEGPLSNGDFFYSYQGISTDGKYYIAAIYPISAARLKKDTPSKAGESLVAKLKEEDFTPNLNDIDKMLQSIVLK